MHAPLCSPLEMAGVSSAKTHLQPEGAKCAERRCAAVGPA